jgi:hypothetical protein
LQTKKAIIIQTFLYPIFANKKAIVVQILTIKYSKVAQNSANLKKQKISPGPYFCEKFFFL